MKNVDAFVWSFQPQEEIYQLGPSSTAEDILSRLGKPDREWDDGVECSIEYFAKFGSVRFLCETTNNGTKQARLKSIAFELD